MKALSILAWEMNYEPLPLEHGAPLRLRVENQLGYKMVKWIKTIEFVETYKTIGKGYGGTNEDDEYFDFLAST
jgi:DMSO/TMAO reductase YedYZ molybdopterin-dependent catalytic subunit